MPNTFLVAINFDNLKIPFFITPIHFLLYLLIPYTFISLSGMISIYKSKTYLFPYDKTLKYIKNNNINPEIVGGRGWPYFLSNKKPIRAINDWWLYALEEPYKNNYLLKNHKKLLKRKSGYVFWINNSLIENQKNNILLNEIKSISNKIEDQGYYSMYRIK